MRDVLRGAAPVSVHATDYDTTLQAPRTYTNDTPPPPHTHTQFFGCYFNLFRLMAKCGVLSNLLLKDHTHTFVNTGGDVRELDFRFFVGGTKIGAPFHGLKAFFTTPQLSPVDKARARGVQHVTCDV